MANECSYYCHMFNYYLCMFNNKFKRNLISTQRGYDEFNRMGNGSSSLSSPRHNPMPSEWPHLATRRSLRDLVYAIRQLLPLVVIGLLALWLATPSHADGNNLLPSRHQAQFSVQFGEEVIPYKVFGVFVMPNEKVVVNTLQTPKNIDFTVTTNAGSLLSENAANTQNGWTWQAPAEPGAYQLRAHPTDASVADNSLEDLTGLTITLNAFVMQPAGNIRNGKLNGYRIDAYPSKPLRGNPVYLPPEGYVEVTEKTGKIQVAPHFKLREFVAKQKSVYPKYVVMQERLLLKLEMILERLQENGYSADSMVIMSGYRTPYYNKSIGNVQYSRHKWGGAADIFIDESPKDGRMDDLNGDGKSDIADARIISQLIEDIANDAWYQPMVGGLGVYGPKPHRGPFVHVDVRGSKARWENP